MTRFKIRFTEAASKDLVRFYDYLLARDVDAAEGALESIRAALAILESTPYSARKALPHDPFLRELVIPFGGSGYVALFRIGRRHVTSLAVRHQHESDLL